MHFRVRKNIIQLIRVAYDPSKKKGVNTVVGSVRLGKPDLPAELQLVLTPAEVAEFNAWLNTRHRADILRDELAALTLAETLAHAERWFEREGDSNVARTVATDIFAQWQSLRRQMTKSGLLS
jgi:hypothetical protein